VFGAGFLSSVQNLIIIELNKTLKAVSFRKQAEAAENAGKYTGLVGNNICEDWFRR
jgi:hypothetical protein